MSQNHFIPAFPLKTPAGAKTLGEKLPPLMSAMFKAADTIDTVHCSRFMVLSDKTDANRTPIWFYDAHPGLSVQDIHALIADATPKAGALAA
jgi:hypothetical protein